MIPDVAVEKRLEGKPNLLVAWYLMASYGYYHMDKSIISDAMYDSICKRLLDGIHSFEIDHMHLHLCDDDALRAGTAFHLKKSDYPLMVIGATEHVIQENRL